MPSTPPLSERLKIAREARGLTMRGLDRLAGLHEGHVAQIEREGIKGVEGTTIKKLSDALNIPSAWLGFNEGPSPFEAPRVGDAHTASDFAPDPRPSQAA